jgi:hypothetical protein
MIMGRRKWIVATVVLLLISAAGWFAYSINYAFTVSIPSAYALWYSGDLIVAYVREHRGGWPTNWDDLRPYWPDVRDTSGRLDMAFARIQELVEIDWQRLPDEFNKAKENDEPRMPRLIRRRDGKQAHWSSGEPHEIILFHLRSDLPVFWMKPRSEPNQPQP